MLGYWPGSAVHQRAVLSEPRFEDFDYSTFDDTDDEDFLTWMGIGMVSVQVEGRRSTGYLDTVGIPPIPWKETEPLTPPSPDEDVYTVLEKVALDKPLL